jgi:plasmid stabilization system protein ParE
MSSYGLTPLAKADIFEIWRYIAQDYEACEFLAAGPLRGHVRRDLTNRTLRFWTLVRYPNYTLVYRPETKPLEVVAVLQGKRNVRAILRNRP